jgi:hypothetical protein
MSHQDKPSSTIAKEPQRLGFKPQWRNGTRFGRDQRIAVGSEEMSTLDLADASITSRSPSKPYEDFHPCRGVILMPLVSCQSTTTSAGAAQEVSLKTDGASQELETVR